MEKILCSVTKGVFDKIKLSTVLKHLYLNNKTAPSISDVTFQGDFIRGWGKRSEANRLEAILDNGDLLPPFVKQIFFFFK